jgi:hypothetical protein
MAVLRKGEERLGLTLPLGIVTTSTGRGATPIGFRLPGVLALARGVRSDDATTTANPSGEVGHGYAAFMCKRRRQNPSVKRPDCPVAPE